MPVNTVKSGSEGTEPKGNLRKAGVLISAHLINDVYPNLYPVLLPSLLMPQLHFGTAAAGLISTVSAMTTQLLQPFLGFWADRIGGRKFVVGGLTLGSIIVPLTLGWAPSYALLLVGLLLGGLGNASFHPHAAALMSEMTGKRKGTGMSFFMVGGNLGRALASLLASFAIFFGGRHGLWLVSIPGLIMALAMAFNMNPPPAPKPREEKILTPEFLEGLRRSRGLLAVVGLRFMTIMSTVTLVPIIWEKAGYSEFVYASLLTVIYVSGMVGNLFGGALSDVWGPKPIIVTSAVLSSLWLILFVNVHSVILGFILIALLGASLYATGPVTMVLSHRLFPKNKGMASGITVGLGGMLGSFGVALTGFVADLSTTTMGLYVAAAAVLLSIPFIINLKLPDND